MDALSLGVFNVIPYCVLWVPGRKSAGAYGRLCQGKENDLFEYYNHLQFYKLMNQYRLYTSKKLLQKATTLIELINEEYHLK